MNPAPCPCPMETRASQKVVPAVRLRAVRPVDADRMLAWRAEPAARLHQPLRDLTREELIDVSVGLGRERALWEHLVRHDPAERYYVELYRDVHLDVWLICWLDAQDTGYHDHDLSSGAVYVVAGDLCEDYFYRDADGWIEVRTRERRAGQVFDFEGSWIHGWSSRTPPGCAAKKRLPSMPSTIFSRAASGFD